ncbi:MAG: polyprenyl synthetase family protein [Acidobacteriota bacterium]|nr:polyprenyl synthetase family protein [Acidobacteriota bacterium]
MNDPQIETWVDSIDTELVRYFAEKDMSCNPLDRAMEYTVLAGGKRLRPLLTMVTCAEYGGDGDAALPISLASELLHTYSLIHDDLPCMDNDDMRRGKPANHVIFGEANAILAADALQTEAFHILAVAPYPNLSAERRVKILAEFAEAVGKRGMVAGQIMDLSDEGKKIQLERLKQLHRRKTGALLRFCVRLGGHLADADKRTMAHLTRYADAIGLLFQVVDDMLDEGEGGGALGKTPGKDAAAGKAAFPRLMGMDNSKTYADQLLQDALAPLAANGRQDGRLALLANYIRTRVH